MAEKTGAVRALLDQLREPKMDNKRLFVDFLPEAWKVLGLKGEPDLVSLEALLIAAVVRKTTPEKDQPPILKNKDMAKKRDAYLLTFGLLKKYYHTKEDGTHYTAAKRHKQYLSDVNYVTITYPGLLPSNELNINDSRSWPRQNLSQDDLRCRKALSEYLASSAICQKCLEEGLEKFTREVKLSDGSFKRQIILPEPCYTLENFSSSQDTTEIYSQRASRHNMLLVAKKFIRMVKIPRQYLCGISKIAITIGIICIVMLGALLFSTNIGTEENLNNMSPSKVQDQHQDEAHNALKLDAPTTAQDDSKILSDEGNLVFPNMDALIMNSSGANQLISDAQEPITCLDEFGNYDLSAMHLLVENRIISNPIYGDMVARGLFSTYGTGQWMDKNSIEWLRDNIERTNSEGIISWTNYSHEQVFVTDDYVYFADGICNLFNSLGPVGVFDMESQSNWSLPAGAEGIYAHAEENEEQITGPVLIYQYVTMGQTVETTFGFYLQDGRFAIYNPAILPNSGREIYHE